MQNARIMAGWKFVVLAFILFVGGAVGVRAGSSIYHGGGSWFGPLAFGVFCGGLASIVTLLLVSGLFRFLGVLLDSRTKREKMCRFVPAWLFLGFLGLLMYGGMALFGFGIIFRSHVCRAVGVLAMTGGFGVIVSLALAGLCFLGWKKRWKRG